MNAIALEQKYKSPLQRYPGSKRGYLPKLWDECETESVVEPFAGAAHYSFERLNQGWIFAPKQVFLGEQDKGVRAIYQTWLEPETYGAFYTRLEFWRMEFCFSSADSAWKALVREIEEWSVAPELDPAQTAYFACAALVLRKLTFGGVVRNNAKGKLNIKYCEGQVNELIGWNFIFPPIPEADVSICSDWLGAIASFKNSDFRSAEALIDPPYYAPKQKGKVCTAAYLGHEPHSDRTRKLCTDAFEACLMDRRFRLVNVTNYFSDELDQELGAIASKYSVKLERSIQDGLKAMNKSGNEKAGEVEAIWTVRRALS